MGQQGRRVSWGVASVAILPEDGPGPAGRVPSRRVLELSEAKAGGSFIITSANLPADAEIHVFDESGSEVSGGGSGGASGSVLAALTVPMLSAADAGGGSSSTRSGIPTILQPLGNSYPKRVPVLLGPRDAGSYAHQ